MIRLYTLFFIIFFFTACGGGSSATIESSDSKTLYLVDSPINGVNYECGLDATYHGQTGYKNGKPTENGSFICIDSAIYFSIGSLKLGTIPKQTYINGQKIYPQTFFNVQEDLFENPNVLNFAQFLQSIDDDGKIEEAINITQSMKDKISTLNITTIDWNSNEEVLNILKKLNVSIRNKKEVTRHLLVNTDVPYIENKTIIIKDNITINSNLEPLNIINDNNITNIEILKGIGKEYFSIDKDGIIKVIKKLQYTKQKEFNLTVRAKSHYYSNQAELNIKIIASKPQEMQPIKAPIIQYINGNSKIYTNSPNYQVTLSGRKATKIYWQGSKIAIMPISETIVLARTINTENSEKSYKLRLAYDNGDSSSDTTLKVVYDIEKPNITTDSNISINENVTLAKSIVATDNFQDDGLTFSLSGGADLSYFTISSTKGVLKFNNRVDYELPKDFDKDNIYEVEVRVEDKAGNFVTKLFKVVVADILDSKPSIEPFEELVDISFLQGDTLGKVNIDNGDSELLSLYLQGTGNEYFDIHNNGEIILMQKLQNEQTFHLEVIAINEFGETKQSITIKIISNTKTAIVKTDDPLSNAEVKIIHINQDNTQELIDTVKTNNQGRFDLKTNLLKNNSFYIYEIDGGENKGLLRMIAKGSWIKESSNIMITPLSEMLYDYVAYYIKEKPTQLENKLQASAKALLSKDLTGDYIIDAKDIMVFNPINNYLSLHTTLKYNNSYQNIVNKIIQNNKEYIKTLFNAKVVKSFVEVESTKQDGIFSYKGEVKFNGSIAYYHFNNSFYIYDMHKQEIVNKLTLESQDYSDVDPLRSLFLLDNAFNIQIYLDLKNSRAYVVNLNEKVFIIDISNLRDPILLGSFHMDWGHFIALSSNNHLYMYSNDIFLGSFNIYDTTNPKNVVPLGTQNIKEYNSITDTNVYAFSKTECSTTNKLKITSHKIIDIENNIDKEILYYISSLACNENAYFDNRYMYIFSEQTDTFEMYKLIEEVPTAIFLDKISLGISKILNINNNIVYAYGNGNIYFIDISDTFNLKVIKTIPYKYQYNSLIYFGGANNLNITIQDDFIVESSRLIDLKVHELSSIYTEKENGIDMSLFNKSNL